MNWFRLHRTRVAAAAFFALACQFALSFGHVHLDAARPLPVWSDLSRASASPGDTPSNPPADDYCAICATISLANALVMPTPPVLVPPADGVRQAPQAVAVAASVAVATAFFDARGPPSA